MSSASGGVEPRSAFNVTALIDGRLDSSNSSVDGFFISLGINAAIGIVLLILFVTLRTVKV